MGVICIAMINIKKYLAILIILLPSLIGVSVGIYFIWHIYLSTDSEIEVVHFCNKLEIGDDYSIVITEARNIKDLKLSDLVEDRNSAILSSKGLTYTSCLMKFKDEKLIEKWVSLS